ncbi:GTP-binding protein TrmE N-terminus-domain-containing protein [Podospora conica]|nr:GTP-binding protein TrmE N-terminus-domain-containing protein [Schizothecium conicum]
MFRYALRRAVVCRLQQHGSTSFSSHSLRQVSSIPKRCRDLGRRPLSSTSHPPSVAVRDGDLSILSRNDTIYALSSAPGRGGIAVIRVSGPGCVDVYRNLCPTKALPKPRHAVVRTLVEPGPSKNANVVDSDAMVLYFPAPKTVTGEDVLELHVHGGTATVKAVLGAIPKTLSDGTIRYAEPGEFTKRAFLNNRLDLAQVESLGDTLSAETEQQRRAAVRGTSGELGKTYEAWRAQLLLARGEIEALIDFSEDQHFDESPAALLTNVRQLVDQILQSIQQHKDGSQRNELLRNGIRIALLGPPNVGKSSLMNQIVGREASIVSPEAGTTRDIVEASLDIRGYLCSFADTAGIRTAASPSARDAHVGAVEQEGIRRARKKAADSDVIIVLASVETSPEAPPRLHYDAETLHLASRAQQSLVVINKCDVLDTPTLTSLIRDFQHSVLHHIPGLATADPLPISCLPAPTPAPVVQTIHQLTERLVQSFSALTALPEDRQHLLGVTARQGQLLDACQRHLEDFAAEAGDGGDEAWEPDVVLAAEHLRLAANQLAAITGRGDSGDVEEVLGVIFEKFCVGK